MKTVAIISIIRRTCDDKLLRFAPTFQGAGFVSIPEAVTDFNARRDVWKDTPEADRCFRFSLILDGEVVSSFDAPKQAYVDALGPTRQRLADDPWSALPAGRHASLLTRAEGAPAYVEPSVQFDAMRRIDEYAAHFPDRYVWACATPRLNHWYVKATPTRAGANAAAKAGYVVWIAPPLRTKKEKRADDAAARMAAAGASVLNIELPTITKNALIAEGITSVSQLRERLDAGTLLRVRGIGAGGLGSIRHVLTALPSADACKLEKKP